MSPDLEQTQRLLKPVCYGNNRVRYLLDGHDETLAFSTQSDAAKAWELLRRIETAHISALLSERRAREAAEQERDRAEAQCAEHQRGENEALNALSTLSTQIRELVRQWREEADESERVAAHPNTGNTYPGAQPKE